MIPTKTTFKEKKDAIVAYMRFNKGLVIDNFKFKEGEEYEYNIEDHLGKCQNGYLVSMTPEEAAMFSNPYIDVYHKVLIWGTIEYCNFKDYTASNIKILEEVNIIDEILNQNKDTDDFNNLFSKEEDLKISNRFLGSVRDPFDWEIRVRSKSIHIGDKILINDGEYNVLWRCVHKKNDSYYFLSDSIAYCSIHPIGDLNSHHFKDTWLYNTILVPFKKKLDPIFGQNVYTNLPSKEEVCRDYIEHNFTFFKLCHIFHIYYYLHNGQQFHLRSISTTKETKTIYNNNTCVKEVHKTPKYTYTATNGYKSSCTISQLGHVRILIRVK